MSFANQMRILKQNFVNIGSQIGSMLIYTFKPALIALNDALAVTAVYANKALNALGNIFGWEIEDFNKGIVNEADYMEDFGDSLDDASDSASKLKKQLQGFDELNNLTSSSNGNGSGNGVSGITLSEEDYGFKKAKDGFESDINSLYELGKHISDTLTKSLKDIKWDDVYASAKDFGTGLANFLNGLFQKDTFKTLGDTIGGLLNSSIYEAIAFGTTFDFENFGSGLAEGINGFFTTTDFSALGQGVAIYVNGLFETVKSFFDTANWEAIGNAIPTTIGNFLGNVDWGTVGGTISSFGKSLFTFLDGVITGIPWDQLPQKIVKSIVDFFSGIDWGGTLEKLGTLIGDYIVSGIDLLASLNKGVKDVAKTVRNYFVEKFKEAGWDKDAGIINNGKAIIHGLFSGIITALGTVGTWINNNIFSPFMKGIKSAFGINGNISDKFVSVGTSIVNGIKNGISGFQTWVKEYFTNCWKKITGAFSNVKSWFKTNVTDNITSAISGIATTFSTVGADAWKNLKSGFSGVKTFFVGIAADVKAPFATIAAWFKTTFTTAWTNVKNVFSTGGTIFKGIANGISSVFTSVVKKLVEGINNVISVPFDTLNDVLYTLKKWKIPGVGTKPFSALPTIPVPQIPVNAFANGGFPEDGWFRASHGEYLGKFDDGTSVVANNAQIIQGINLGVAQGMRDANYEQNALLREQNELLLQILRKETGIKSSDVFRAVRAENKKFYDQTGDNAFVY